MRALVLVACLLLAGCAQGSLLEVAEVAERRGWAHCGYYTGGVPGYGAATVLTQSGELDCLRVWQRLRGATP